MAYNGFATCHIRYTNVLCILKVMQDSLCHLPMSQRKIGVELAEVKSSEGEMRPHSLHQAHEISCRVLIRYDGSILAVLGWLPPKWTTIVLPGTIIHTHPDLFALFHFVVAQNFTYILLANGDLPVNLVPADVVTSYILRLAKVFQFKLLLQLFHCVLWGLYGCCKKQNIVYIDA